MVPDPVPLRDPSHSDSGGIDTTNPGQIVVVAGLEGHSAAQAVVISALSSDGIPMVAAKAYQHGADLANQRTAGCALPWTLLAAIGRVESDHGRFGDSVLLASGLSAPRIIGIPLNGIGTGLVLDTDNGVLDRDPVFDRAVGPMQFIPSTWALYATDGNGDGIADPFNIYDAAAAAGNYLCKAGRDLGTRAGRVRAVLAYNHSDSYVAEVLGLEATYAGTPVSMEPSPVMPIISAALPPVNPGVPPAISPIVLRIASPAPTSPSPGSPSPLASTPGALPTATDAAPSPTATDAAPSPTPTGTTATGTTPSLTPTPTDATPAPTSTPTDATLTNATSSPTPTPTNSTPSPTPTPTSTCTPLTPPPTDAPGGTLSDAQKSTLAAIAEGQQLAHDLYLAFANKLGASVFACMSNDQARQLTNIRNVLKVYAVPDPTAGQPAGTFANASTQQLYDTLLTQGATGLDAALVAARKVESTAITDLTAATTNLTAPDVLQLYTNLLGASRIHLAAVGG